MATPTQIKRRGRWSLILGTVFAFAAIAAVGYASDATTSVADVDTPLGSVTLAPGGSDAIRIQISITGQQAGTATFKINRNWSLSGGTFTGSNPATFSVNRRESNDPATVIETTGTVSAAAGQADGTFSLSVPIFDITNSNATGAKLAFKSAASYSVTVKAAAPADTEAPKNVSISINSGGAWTNDASGNVNLSLSATDNVGIVSYKLATSEDGLELATATPVSPAAASFSQSVSPFPLGGSEGAAREVWLKVCDAAGNCFGDKDTIGWDRTKPTISGSAYPAANDGWNNTAVAVAFDCDDALSGIASCTAPVVLSEEGVGQSVNGTATDNAGNSESASVTGINIDTTPPNAPTVSLSAVANNQGWYNGAVTVSFAWAGDAGAAAAQSGAGSCTDPILVSSGSATDAGTTVSGTCTDKAGNTSAATDATVKLDLTAPTIVADAGSYAAGSWTNQTVTVSFQCFEALSGLLGTCPAAVVVSSDTPTTGQNVSKTISDNAGNTGTSSTINVKVDKTPPTISGSRLPVANGAGWNNTDVEVSFSCEDTPSGVASCSSPVTLESNGASQSVSGTAVDNAGNSASTTVSGINIDKLAPSVAYTSAQPAPNGAGWNNTDVVATFSASDTLSGFAPSGALTLAGTSTTSAEGNNVSVGSPAFMDRAGNNVLAGAATSESFKIDKTKPVVNVTGVESGATYKLGAVPTAGCSTSDALSGVKTNATLTTTGGPVGSVTAACGGAEDNAGNTNSKSVTYSVVYDWNGFFQPVDNLPAMNKAKAGSAIPVKFSLGGNQGLNIFAAGYPATSVSNCTNLGSADLVEETVTAGGSSLTYDSSSGQYVYVWKTQSVWSGTCRTLTVKLIDGTIHQANFYFVK